MTTGPTVSDIKRLKALELLGKMGLRARGPQKHPRRIRPCKRKLKTRVERQEIERRKYLIRLIKPGEFLTFSADRVLADRQICAIVRASRGINLRTRIEGHELRIWVEFDH